MEKKLRLAIVDDHVLMRKGIRLYLEKRAGLSVVMEAENTSEACRLIPETDPDVVVLDLSMPGEDGFSLIRRIRAQWPRIKVIVFTGSADDQSVGQAFLAGANAFLRKENTGRELIRAVETVVQGKSYVSADAATGLVNALRSQSAPPALTDRESAVLKGIAEGRSYKEIAGELAISPKSVETYRGRLAKKLGCPNRADLVRYAVREGLVAQ